MARFKTLGSKIKATLIVLIGVPLWIILMNQAIDLLNVPNDMAVWAGYSGIFLLLLVAVLFVKKLIERLLKQ